MTPQQRERITQLRGYGKSYAMIAAVLGISENTVKTFCRRNNLGARSVLEQTNDACGNCGAPLMHTPGAKKRRFCSDRCRMAWWQTHPEAVNRKAVYQFRCEYCNAVFQSYGNANRKYCSPACAGAARRTLR